VDSIGDGIAAVDVIELVGELPGLTCAELAQPANVLALKKGAANACISQGIELINIIGFNVYVCGVDPAQRKRRQANTATYSLELISVGVQASTITSFTAAATASTLNFGTIIFVDSNNAPVTSATILVTGVQTATVSVAELLDPTADLGNLIRQSTECPAECIGMGKSGKKAKKGAAATAIDCSACPKGPKKGPKNKRGKKESKGKKSTKGKKAAKAARLSTTASKAVAGASFGLVAVLVLLTTGLAVLRARKRDHTILTGQTERSYSEITPLVT